MATNGKQQCPQYAIYRSPTNSSLFYDIRMFSSIWARVWRWQTNPHHTALYEVSGSNFLRNSGAYPPNYTVSLSRTKYDLNIHRHKKFHISTSDLLARSLGKVGLTSFMRTRSLYRKPSTFSLYTHHIEKRFTCSEDVILIGRKIHRPDYSVLH